jgi:hypothetical protein
MLVTALLCAALAAPADEGHDATIHHSFDDVAKWVDVFDDPARDAWQKPDVLAGSRSRDDRRRPRRRADSTSTSRWRSSKGVCSRSTSSPSRGLREEQRRRRGCWIVGAGSVDDPAFQAASISCSS